MLFFSNATVRSKQSLQTASILPANSSKSSLSMRETLHMVKYCYNYRNVKVLPSTPKTGLQS